MLELQWPWVFVITPLPYLIYRFMTPASQSGGSALQVPFYRHLTSIAGNNLVHQNSRRQLSFILPVVIWLLLLLAAARPVWLGEPIQLQGTGRDVMLAVDLSGSMEINDMELNGVAVDRLVVTKHVLTDFIERRTGDRLGLILFGTQAYLQAPLTFDLKTVGTLMDESAIGMAGNKTAIGDALGLAVKHLRNRPQDSRVLILLTDGANTAGEITPLQAARLAAEEGIKIYSIGMGAEEMIQPGIFGTSFGARRVNPSADLDEKTLTEMANLTGGRYFRAKNTEELEQIYSLLDELEPVLQDKENFRPGIALYYWPLLLALVLSFVTALVHPSLRSSDWLAKYKTQEGA
ncbi:BatB protein [Endozoicomonas montiporae]|uniref:BatB protein n=2 Tax=Endozoicomonas montiporae TaxID=1027273 RepID=A0A081NA04_9GAMM|nr:VWA domain-containing protein [Endozoicomonas montiporae]AMO57051.1 Ca-activated chloride channel-like [Endozoicomonas montiporae CL-33]KEQ15277.1 BatB protein [Endozoicomonas montiporae]